MGAPAEAWHWREEALPGGSIGAWLERGDGRRATIRELLEGWQRDAALQALTTTAFARIPFDAYSWETPPMTAADLDRPFECVFVDNPELAATSPDPGPFEAQFAPVPTAPAATFRNLGGDAWLVAPLPQAGPLAYTHLAAFVRSAPPEQVHATWRLLAEAVLAHVGESTRWLSTAGLGVYWLHFRIDSRPKYYRHDPYKPAQGWSSIDER